MGVLATTLFVFLAGLTLSGLSGTVMEIVAGRRLSLREPFVSPGNVSRSLVLMLLAGPFMTMNEALRAIRAARIGPLAFACVVAFCCLWLSATGVFVFGLVQNVSAPVG